MSLSLFLRYACLATFKRFDTLILMVFLRVRAALSPYFANNILKGSYFCDDNIRSNTWWWSKVELCVTHWEYIFQPTHTARDFVSLRIRFEIKTQAKLMRLCNYKVNGSTQFLWLTFSVSPTLFPCLSPSLWLLLSLILSFFPILSFSRYERAPPFISMRPDNESQFRYLPMTLFSLAVIVIINCCCINKRTHTQMQTVCFLGLHSCYTVHSCHGGCATRTIRVIFNHTRYNRPGSSPFF